MSKLNYGAELWAGAPQYMLKKIQTEMIQAARINLGFQSLRFNIDKLMEKMGWKNIFKTLQVANARLAHQLINLGVPEVLSFKFCQSNQNVNENGKPPPSPPNFGHTRIFRTLFRYQAQKIYTELPDWLTKIKNKNKFKKWHKNT